jgi:hypothetical protein
MSITIEHAEHVTLQIGNLQDPQARQLVEKIMPSFKLQDEAAVPRPGEIWPGQGGIYVGTVPAMLGAPARHLIAGKHETKLPWGGYDHETSGASSHVDGPANTKALLADSEKHPAAAWCENYQDDGHHDFHLPSRFDLLIAFLTAPQVFEKEGWYWSSTQASRRYAFVQAFASGNSGWSGKDVEFRVRAFRWIHFNP